MNILNTTFEWILSAGLRASVLVLLVLGAQWLLRNQLPARWRYALWLPVLIALLVPALPVLPFSFSTTGWLSTPQDPATLVAMREAPSPDQPTPLSSSVDSAATTVGGEGLPASLATPGFIDGEAKPTPAVESTRALEAAAENPIHWNALAVKAWFVGAVAVVLLALTSFVINLRRIKRTAQPVSAELMARIEHLARAAGLRRAPRVWKSPAVPSPAVCGLSRPVLLLNENFEDELSEDEVGMVLRHELVHIRRGDLLLNALQCGLLALHWFNPFLWVAFCRVRADREAARDEDVLRDESAPQRAVYGHALLKMETAFPPPSLGLGFAGILAGGSALRVRIQSIAARRRLNGVMTAVVATGVAVLTLLGITDGRLSAQEEGVVEAEEPEELVVRLRFEGEFVQDAERTWVCSLLHGRPPRAGEMYYEQPSGELDERGVVEIPVSKPGLYGYSLSFREGPTTGTAPVSPKLAGWLVPGDVIMVESEPGLQEFTIKQSVPLKQSGGVDSGDEVGIEALGKAHFIQGSAPDSWEPGKLYVLACWATWSDPSVAAIPHLDALHDKYHDKGVVVIGMNVREEAPARVAKFVNEKGDGMSYPVAHVGGGGAFAETWLHRTDPTPHVFVVKDGKLLLETEPTKLTPEVIERLFK